MAVLRHDPAFSGIAAIERQIGDNAINANLFVREAGSCQHPGLLGLNPGAA
jgi:hypothetical protein